VAVAEPIPYKRQRLGETYIWGKAGPSDGQAFEDWKQFLKWEQERRVKAANGDDVPEGVDAVFICVLDEMHKEVIVGLAPLGLHIMCEKPLATSLEDCVSIYKAMLPNFPNTTPSKIFSIGHVLRYSPHNMLLRKLLLEDRVIGEVMSVNHTEPIGWWHFTHSYVRYASRKVSIKSKYSLQKRKLAQGIHHRSIPPHKVLPRYRLTSLAALLPASQLRQAGTHTHYRHVVRISSILQQDSEADGGWKCYKLPLVPDRDQLQVLCQECLLRQKSQGSWIRKRTLAY
jgi:hypothetical protein